MVCLVKEGLSFLPRGGSTAPRLCVLTDDDHCHVAPHDIEGHHSDSDQEEIEESVVSLGHTVANLGSCDVT